MAHKQKYDMLADPRTLNAELSPDLGALILKCLAKDKKARYQSASEVRADLDRVLTSLLTTNLSRDEALKVADVSTSSLDAYEHYQKGVDWLLRWNPATIKELEQAVAIDPTFAGAWVALAQARVGYQFGLNPFAEVPAGADAALREARKYASRATERERLQTDLLDA